MLPVQRLDVYQCALEFAAKAHKVADRSPSSHKELADQLRRASTSTPLNIAEGNGKTGRDCRRFYEVARGSVMECGAAYDVFLAIGVLREEEHAEGMVLLERMIAMLTKMIRK